MIPSFKENAYMGYSTTYGEVFVAELRESLEFPGYYHFAIMDENNYKTSEKPYNKEILKKYNITIDHEEGLTISDFNWKVIDPIDCVLLTEKGEPK